MEKLTRLTVISFVGLFMYANTMLSTTDGEVTVEGKVGTVHQDEDATGAAQQATPEGVELVGVGGGKIQITSKTLKPPTQWKFRQFRSHEQQIGQIQVINPGLGYPNPWIDFHKGPPTPEAPEVLQADSDNIQFRALFAVPTTAGTWPLRAEGNLIPYGGSGGVIVEKHWRIELAEIVIDFDVDSDNSTPNALYPDTTKGDRSSQEDGIEESSPVLVFINRSDTDRDGVPGFADGIDKFGNQGSGTTVNFVRAVLKVTLPPSSTNSTITFHYPASDPNDVTRSSSDAPDEDYVYNPGEGSLRIWTKDGPDSRRIAAVDNGGDFIPSGHAFSVSSLPWNGLSEAVLYLEAVDIATVGESATITVTVDPDGSGDAAGISDVVTVQYYPIEDYNPGNSTIPQPAAP